MKVWRPLVIVILLTGCGAGSGVAASIPDLSPSPTAQTATAAPTEPAAPSAAPKAAPAFQAPHGSPIYEMKVDHGQANVAPKFSDASLNKVQIVDNGIEFSAAPKGVAGINLPGVSVDNFVASLRLKTVTGQGDYSYLVRVTPGADQTGVRASTRTGSVGVNTYDARSRLKGPQLPGVLMWPRDSSDEVSLVVTALGPVMTLYVNGTKVGETKHTPVIKGSMTFNVLGPPDGDLPFVTRLTELAIYEPDAAALASASSAPATQPLPPHGASLYELKLDPPAANVQVYKFRPADKMLVAADSVELTASPGGGRVAAIVPDLTFDDFVAEMRIRPVSGEGSFGLVFHTVTGGSQSAFVYSGTGQAVMLRVATTTNSAGKPASSSKLLVGPLLRLAPNATDDTDFVVQAHGNDLTFSLNGKEVGHATDPGAKGALSVDVFNGLQTAIPASASASAAPFVVRLEDLRVYAAG